MGKRREVGDIVRKKANAGFIGEALVIQLVDLDPEWGPTDSCQLCDEEHCKEWCNSEVLENGKPTGKYVYHVSECEMEDYDAKM